MSGSSARPDRDRPLSPGEALAGRFRVVRRVAQGGMGVVYEAFDEKLQRRIALKCARGGHGQHLTPEVRLATEVSHPNICKIYEIHNAETAEGPVEFFTMEFLDGPTLARRLGESPMEGAEAERIARQLCAGLAEAHRHGIVHGDLKSANVILTRNPDESLRAVITDFGLARAANAEAKAGGTRGYMAPELYKGAASSVASDIYALGVMLHELACGYRPDERAQMLASTLTKTAEGGETGHGERAASVTAPPLHSRWDRVIRKCLLEAPEERYQSADEIQRALGPSRKLRNTLLAAGVLALAGAAAFIAYERASAPPQTVKLSMEGVRGEGGLEEAAAQLSEAGRKEIARLKRSVKTGIQVLPAGRSSAATHRLAAELTARGEKIGLHARLSEAQSGAPVMEWTAEYERWQLRYAPVALAGVVSRGLHLPALETYGRVGKAEWADYQRGVALLPDDGKLDDALQAFRGVAAADPDSAPAFAGMAEVERRKYFLTKNKEWEQEALASLGQAELRNSDFAELHRIAGLLEFDRGRVLEAIAREARATEFQPPNEDAFLRLGQLYRRNGQLGEARQAYGEAQRIAPGDVRVYQALGNVYFDESDFPGASKAWETAVRLAPERAALRSLLAASYVSQGRFREAEGELREALRHENTRETLVELGHVLLYQKRDADAAGVLLQAAAIDGGDPWAWLYLGLAYGRTERQAEARRAFTRGLALAEADVEREPRSGRFRAMLGYLCAQLGDVERGRAEAAQSMQLAPADNDTLWWSALTYERAGNRADALKALERAPRPVLDDLRRWPEAAALAGDAGFERLAANSRGR